MEHMILWHTQCALSWKFLSNPLCIYALGFFLSQFLWLVFLNEAEVIANIAINAFRDLDWRGFISFDGRVELT